MDTELTLNDLVVMVQAIDIGASRGAWRGPELQSIGALRTKLDNIAQEAQKTAAQQEQVRDMESKPSKPKARIKADVEEIE